MKIPEGFHPVTLERMLFKLAKAMPTLGQMLFQHMGLPEQEVAERIVTLEDQQLIQFAVNNSQPSLFIAPKNQFQSPEDHAFAEKMVSFWDVQGKFDPDGGEVTETDLSHLVVRIMTPDGDIGVVAAVANRLVNLGLLTRDAQGHVHGTSKAHVLQLVDEHGICDFCSDPDPKHIELVPDFELVPETGENSIGGWATCDTCHEMVKENRRADLLQRGIAASHGGKFTAAALQGLHARFWEATEIKAEAAGIGSALIDFIEDRIEPDKVFVNPKLQQRAARIEAIRRLTGMTTDEMNALVKGDLLYKDVAKKLSTWRKKFGADNYAGARKIAQMLNDSERKLPPNLQPHWQIALDQKVAAITHLSKIDKLPPDSPVWVEVNQQDLREDLRALRAAEVYSFNADTIHAIMAGAQTLPHDATLQSVEVPRITSGWFWFAEPLPFTPSPLASDTTAAILWSWETVNQQVAIRFSLYVVDEKSPTLKGQIFPSAKWLWPLGASFHQMIGLNAQKYRDVYGPGGPYEHMKNRELLIGEDAHMKVVSDVSLFFMMSCLWFRQTVPGSKKKIEPKLTQLPGHIERHARKRYEKEFKAAPSVRVIALRRSARSEVTESPAEGKHHTLHVRFVVKGHPRLQRCGPELKDQKLIWIDPYPKGPEDAPFKGPDDTVFAVVR